SKRLRISTIIRCASCGASGPTYVVTRISHGPASGVTAYSLFGSASTRAWAPLTATPMTRQASVQDNVLIPDLLEFQPAAGSIRAVQGPAAGINPPLAKRFLHSLLKTQERNHEWGGTLAEWFSLVQRPI